MMGRVKKIAFDFMNHDGADAMLGADRRLTTRLRTLQFRRNFLP